MLGGDPAIESQGEPNWLQGWSLFEEYYSLPALIAGLPNVIISTSRPDHFVIFCVFSDSRCS